MALFQPAPRTAEDLERCKPLEIPPNQVLEFDEAEWYRRAYRGNDVPQLTWRAVLMGGGLGFFLSSTNIYVGLKTGWFLGVAITACILSYAIWTALQRIGFAKTPMTILENNCMQSTASAAGYAVGHVFITAIPAMMLLNKEAGAAELRPSLWVIGIFVGLCGMLGTVLGIPFKRNMINRERLKFPSGVAAAVTLQSLYSQGKEALEKARALLIGGGFGMALSVLKDLEILKKVGDDGKIERHAIVPGASNIFDWIPNVFGFSVGLSKKLDKVTGQPIRYLLSDYHVKLDHSLVMVASGAIIGLRVTASMLFGSLVFLLVDARMGMHALVAKTKAGFLAPGVIPEGAYDMVAAVSKPASAVKEVGIWFGAPLLVAAGLMALAFQWRTIARAFAGLLGKGKSSSDDGTYRTQGRDDDKLSAKELSELVEKTEVPTKWFAIGMAVPGTIISLFAWKFFEIPIHYGLLAVVFSFILGLVACRATGETDITPSGPLGKLMQLTYGVLIPQSTTANLMTAGITSGAGGAAADLLNDLKSGYLLGANPRRQFLAQFFGLFVGAVASTLCFAILVPDMSVFDGDNPKFPAPGMQQWYAVAKLFRDGVANFHPFARSSIGYGLMAGVAMASLEALFSREGLKKYKKWLPSPTGFGLGFVVPFYINFSFFLGAVIAEVLYKANKEKAEKYIVPVASGVIAGESIMGVIVTAINNFVL